MLIGNALRLRAQETGDSSALAEAVEILRAAVEASEVDQPSKAASLLSLGDTLWGLASIANDPAALDDAATSWEQAARTEAASIRVRIEAARHWGDTAIERGEISRGSEGLALAVKLLPQLASWHIDLLDQERQLTGFLGLASDAAACKLTQNAPDEALKILEQGRSVLLGKVLDLRSDSGALRDRAPELAAMFQRLTEEVAAEWVTLGEDQDSDRSPIILQGQASDRRHIAARQLDEVIEKIRTLPGFETFLKPPSLEDLAPAAEQGPVVVVNVSRYRSDALILTPNGVDVVTLPGMEAPMVHERTLNFLSAVDDFLMGRSFGNRIQGQQGIESTLEWLWDSLAEPVLRRLGYHRALGEFGEWPRVFWCPTGLLSLLPVHAAGYHETASDAVPRTVMDRVVSSYTTTVRALLMSHNTLTRRTAADQPNLLVVSLPETPGGAPLPGAAHEAEFLASMFRGALVMSGRNATRAAVRRALPACEWAHFACHATSDLEHPVASGLMLADGLMTVRDISKIRLENADLVVLSGCGTGRGGVALADEAIHIASAFQMAGFPHVIGTLWPISDRVAADFASVFYSDMLNGHADAALALHVAVRKLRSRFPKAPFLWASMTHLGASRGFPGEIISVNSHAAVGLAVTSAD